MNSLSRMTLAVVLVAVALSSAGCRQERRLVIAFVPMGPAQFYWKSVHAGAMAAARLHDVEILWREPRAESDVEAQKRIVDALLSSRVDAIALAPIDKEALVPLVERAHQQKIPVVIFDSPIGTDAFLAQVATDNYLAGQMAAEHVSQLLGARGQVAILANNPASASTSAREEGFEETLARRYPDIQVVDKRYGMSDSETSWGVAEKMLASHPQLQAIFASNEPGTQGALRAITKRPQRQVKLVGFDFSPALLAGLREGQIEALILQNPYKMGYESIVAAVKKLRGEDVPKMNNLAPRLITRQELGDPEVQALLNPDVH
jgi:ribose transport system substrate-binding protein